MERRDLLKVGLLGAGMAMLPSGEALAKGKGKGKKRKEKNKGSGKGSGKAGKWQSPPTRPWQVELPILPELEDGQGPVPAGFVRSPKQGPADRIDKQYAWLTSHGYSLKDPAPYELHVREAMHSFHPDLPDAKIWGYNGITPGPTIVGHVGEPYKCRVYNHLPADHRGFGVPTISLHHHNVHGASLDDGFPTNYFGPGEYWDYSWPNVRPASRLPVPAEEQPWGDPAETGSTNWYHDHMIDFTGPNVYRGLAGQYRFYDEVDSGDETDPNPKALRLPSGEYDIGLIIQDKQFDGDGNVVYNTFDHDGFLGDKQIVNGVIQPVLKVKRRKYRFRILTAANARWFQFFLSSGQKFIQIATDGGLLESPILRKSIRSATAERNEVIIDFSNYRIGDKIYLENRMEQTDGRGPIRARRRATYQLLRFDVVGDAPDPSRVPNKLREQPPINLDQVSRRRLFEFERRQGAWQINHRFWDEDFVMADPKVGSTEIWTLRNKGGGWWHPIHIHLEYFRILSRNGKRPKPYERGKKDVFELPPNSEVEVYLRFRTFAGRYPIHCHNLEHEDMAMMARWDTVGKGAV